MENKEKLREEALELFNKNANNLVWRSCWNCNKAHEHLKEQNDKFVIECFECGHYFFKGKQISED